MNTVADTLTGVGVTNFVIAVTALVSALGTLIGLIMHQIGHSQPAAPVAPPAPVAPVEPPKP